MISERTKSVLLEDISDIKNVEDVKHVLARLVSALPTNESTAEKVVATILKGLK